LFEVVSFLDENSENFWFSLSTAEGIFCLGFLFLDWTLLLALLGLITMIRIDKNGFQNRC